MVPAAHRTPLRFRLVATTVETVRFTRHERVDFRSSEDRWRTSSSGSCLPLVMRAPHRHTRERSAPIWGAVSVGETSAPLDGSGWWAPPPRRSRWKASAPSRRHTTLDFNVTQAAMREPMTSMTRSGVLHHLEEIDVHLIDHQPVNFTHPVRGERRQRFCVDAHYKLAGGRGFHRRHGDALSTSQ
jgi:hypothetical protein